MHDFQQLQKLELPLEIAMCVLTASASADHELDLDCSESLLGDIVPASVSQLSLISHGTGQHGKALDIMFHDFAIKEASQVPDLKEIHLSCPSKADHLSKEHFAKLAMEAEKVGVALHNVTAR